MPGSYRQIGLFWSHLAHFVDVTISPPDNSPLARSVSLQIDTGTDQAAIHAALVSELSLDPPVDTVYVVGVLGTGERRPVYDVTISVEGLHPLTTRVIGLKNEKAILGRDLLNLWRLAFGDPRQTVEISIPEA